jgi:hypothetical protein
MPTLPQTPDTPLVRTDFSDAAAWVALVEAISTPSDEGFHARVSIVDDLAFAGSSPEDLAAAAAASDHAVLFVADRTTLSLAEMPLLCLALAGGEGAFRVAAAALWGVENNLSIANMDFAEFAEAADEDGVFRGF